MPEQFIKGAEFGVLLAVNDSGVFLNRDGPLRFEFDGRPLQLGQNRPRQPVHSDGEIVGAAQIDIR
jgi:hypothetical protein